MDLVRSKSGAAVAGDFSASNGSPIVLDEVTGKGYVIKVDGNVIELGSGTFQPLDADLTAIAALGFTSTAFLKKTAADTWALDTTAYAPLASPTFTGTPAAPTAASTDDSTQIATTAHVKDYAYSGTYTPTLDNTTNVAASTAYVCQYMRVGNVVTVSGKVDIDVTTTATDFVLGVTLPIASAFTEEEQCAGALIQAIAANVKADGYVRADATNDRAYFAGQSVGTANYSWFFSFTYLVI